jgi:hypothetical protein
MKKKTEEKNPITWCFTMNDTKVFVNFSGYDTPSDLNHEANFY